MITYPPVKAGQKLFTIIVRLPERTDSRLSRPSAAVRACAPVTQLPVSHNKLAMFRGSLTITVDWQKLRGVVFFGRKPRKDLLLRCTPIVKPL
jgi:hypothetical protein